MDVSISKPVEWTTAVAEIYDGERLVAEIFGRHGGERRLYVHNEAVAWGLDWAAFSELVPLITDLLDKADEEIRENDKWLKSQSDGAPDS